MNEIKLNKDKLDKLKSLQREIDVKIYTLGIKKYEKDAINVQFDNEIQNITSVIKAKTREYETVIKVERDKYGDFDLDLQNGTIKLIKK